MRNLKRVLALALALVMMLGMMITASAASYTDEAAINEDYAVAVEVLSDMGVFKGTGAGFAPKAILSRAEAAALIYRVITADVDDKKVDLYDYASFNDVAEGVWYTPYVTYAANGGYILGYDGNFMPNDTVTGVQVLAIMLRAMGYGQKGEFEGAAWKDGVLTVADDLGLLDSVAANDLDKPASRELVAQLLFDAIQAPTTTYTPAFGYWTSAVSLGEKKFELAKTLGTADEWGRPGYAYTYTTGEKETVITYKPTVTYTTAVTECQVSTDTKQKGNVANYTTFTNGAVNVAPDTITATETVATIGAQGRLTEVYAKQGIIVYIDTLLAKVDDVKAATYDYAGHLKTPSSITLTVYDGTTTQVTLTNGKVNYEYAKDDMVLVNAVQTGTTVRTDALYKHVEILGVAETFTGAQTYVWWWADKHTVNGTEYMDNNRFHLDAAGITLGTNYNWYLDQYGNLIGDTAIFTPKNYAVVEGIQWINTWGVNGYAQANVRYMDGTTDTVIVKNLYLYNSTTPVTMAYADYATINIAGGDDFKAGKVSTVWQYNDDCMNDLYEVVANVDGTVSLKEQAQVDTADIKDGVSAVTDGTNVKFYTDNYTVYMIRTQNPVTKAYTYSMVTGYDNLEKNWTVDTSIEADYVMNATNTYAKYVYITGKADDAATKYASEFVYFTSRTSYYGDAMQNNVPCFVIGGLVDAEGNTDVMYVAKNAAGNKKADGTAAGVGDTVDAAVTANATLAALRTFLTNAQDKLYLVKTTDGVVAAMGDMTAVDTTGVAANETDLIVNAKKVSYATFSNKGTFTTVDGNGVIKIQNLADAYMDAINVNSSTTIINEAGKGTITDLNNAVLAGKSIYVVAAYDVTGTNKTTQAVAIFITGTDTTPVVNTVKTVATKAELDAALANNTIKTIKLTASITGVDATIDLAGKNLDGNGYAIVAAKNLAADTGIAVIKTTGGTISNLNVVGGRYGIMVNNSTMTADLTLNNVTVVDSVRALMVGGPAATANTLYKLTVTNSKFAGKISVSETAVSAATFTGCEFRVNAGSAKDNVIEFYTSATFTNCSFADGFKFNFSDQRANGLTFDVKLVGCKAAGVAIADVTYDETSADVEF